MYGETVTVRLGEGIECKVWIFCTPNMTSLEKQHKALGQLKKAIAEKETLIEKAQGAGFDLTR